MNAKQLTQFFKALSSFVSTDATRENITYAYAEDTHTLIATDGHRLLSIKVHNSDEGNAGHGLPRGFYNPKLALATIKAGMQPMPDQRNLELKFPAWREVMPKLRADDAPAAAALYVNPMYLADAAEGAGSAVGLTRKQWGVHVRVQLGESALDPVRLDCTADGVTATALVMPMRK